MKRYIFGIIIAAPENNFRSTVIAGDRELKGLSMSKVLSMGWVPVRETPLSGGDSPCFLVVLERDGEAEPVKSSGSERKAQSEPKARPLPGKKPEAAAIVVPAAATKVAPTPAPVSKAPSPPPAAPAPPAEDEGKSTSDSDISFDFLND